jgi:hypothetical protein
VSFFRLPAVFLPDGLTLLAPFLFGPSTFSLAPFRFFFGGRHQHPSFPLQRALAAVTPTTPPCPLFTKLIPAPVRFEKATNADKPRI